MSANNTPAKSLVKVDASATAADMSSGAYEEHRDIDTWPNKGKQIQASKQKLDELAGRNAEEPLLKENPGRFVLFPIQDNDVSKCIRMHRVIYMHHFTISITTIITHTA